MNSAVTMIVPTYKDLLLAKPFDPEKHNCEGWIASEKLDGVRAFWDGISTIWSRNRKVINAPKWFTSQLPLGVTLDGELFAGRGNFQFLVGAVKKKIPIDEQWRQVEYCVFDAPCMVDKIYTERIKQLNRYGNEIVKICSTWIIKSNEELLRQLETYANSGAEGLMVREPKSLYEWKRSSNLLKLKQRFDSECIVVGHQDGTGKYTGIMGALQVKTVGDEKLNIKPGTKFKVGSGFTDIQRTNYKHLYPVGTIITFRYTELTNSGTPRFPTFFRTKCEIMDTKK
jgi:DNA ligase-1